jgi:hypothetical protein
VRHENAVSNLQNFETGLQTELGNTAKQPIPMPFIQGQQQVENTENAGILSALQGAVGQYQTAIGQGIQGAQVQAGALNSAGSLGTGAQSLEQGALQEAGQLTQPVANATYFGTPETGGLVGNSFAGPMAQYAAMAANGQYNAIPTSITGLR